MTNDQTHRTYTGTHPFGDAFTVRCSCGWADNTAHDTRVEALGAGDRHVARAIGWDRS